MSTPNGGRGDQVKTHEETEENKQTFNLPHKNSKLFLIKNRNKSNKNDINNKSDNNNNDNNNNNTKKKNGETHVGLSQHPIPSSL